jgi:hypothetical protein
MAIDALVRIAHRRSNMDKWRRSPGDLECHLPIVYHCNLDTCHRQHDARNRFHHTCNMVRHRCTGNTMRETGSVTPTRHKKKKNFLFFPFADTDLDTDPNTDLDTYDNSRSFCSSLCASTATKTASALVATQLLGFQCYYKLVVETAGGVHKAIAIGGIVAEF